MKEHEDFRKKLIDHVVNNYSDEHMAAQAATAMMIEYKRKHPDICPLDLLGDIMSYWRGAKEHNYEIIDESFTYNGNFKVKREIHSIKRLSDGEIFEVGGELIGGKILRIFEQGNSFWLDCDNYTVNMNIAIKYKEPTTWEEIVTDLLNQANEEFKKACEPKNNTILTQFEIDLLEEKNVLLGYKYTADDMVSFARHVECSINDNLKTLLCQWEESRE